MKELLLFRREILNRSSLDSTITRLHGQYFITSQWILPPIQEKGKKKSKEKKRENCVCNSLYPASYHLMRDLELSALQTLKENLCTASLQHLTWKLVVYFSNIIRMINEKQLGQQIPNGYYLGVERLSAFQYSTP